MFNGTRRLYVHLHSGYRKYSYAILYTFNINTAFRKKMIIDTYE